jgi:hypothetical protein
VYRTPEVFLYCVQAYTVVRNPYLTMQIPPYWFDFPISWGVHWNRLFCNNLTKFLDFKPSTYCSRISVCPLKYFRVFGDVSLSYSLSLGLRLGVGGFIGEGGGWGDPLGWRWGSPDPVLAGYICCSIVQQYFSRWRDNLPLKLIGSLWAIVLPCSFTLVRCCVQGCFL